MFKKNPKHLLELTKTDAEKWLNSFDTVLTDCDACLFMTTNTDAVHRYPEFRIPGTGALLTALETTVGRKALQFGKPNPEICEELIKSGRLVAERTLMIGDVCKVDILFGHNCGFQTLLVGTGHNSEYELNEVLETPSEKQRFYIPDYFIPSLGNLTELIS